jgi:murein L,D-transpeptidase YcbB/YkuD
VISNVRMGIRIALTASLAASCAAMSRGALFGSSGSVYTSEQARLVQRSLNEHGYPIELTEIYDERTRVAVLGFQRSHGIEATGDIDPATARALGLNPSDVTATRDEDWIQDELQWHTWHDPGGP